MLACLGLRAAKEWSGERGVTMPGSESRYVEIPSVKSGASIQETAQVMINHNVDLVQVLGEDGRPVGWVRSIDLLQSFLDCPAAAGVAQRNVSDLIREIKEQDYLDIDGELSGIHSWMQARPQQAAYFAARDGNVAGVLSLYGLLTEALQGSEREARMRKTAEALVQALLDKLPVGLAVLDDSGAVQQANPLAIKVLAGSGLGSQELLNIAALAETRTVQANGGSYRLQVVPLEAPATPGYLLVAVDITREQALLQHLQYAQQEAEMALATLLPDARIEARLKSVPEYRDEYDQASGKIRITEVIQDGVYRHVINILRLISEISAQGLMELPGLEKQVLVTAAIFHDLGKVQPHLEIGQVVDPKEVFEPGQLHAFRSASLAQGVYRLGEDVVHIIKYHHHEESNLPDSFPAHLLPMYRLFRLLDGLSAGITRRGSRVYLTVDGSLIKVREESTHPAYNRYLELDVYSGKSKVCSLDRG